MSIVSLSWQSLLFCSEILVLIIAFLKKKKKKEMPEFV